MNATVQEIHDDLREIFERASKYGETENARKGIMIIRTRAAHEFEEGTYVLEKISHACRSLREYIDDIYDSKKAQWAREDLSNINHFGHDGW